MTKTCAACSVDIPRGEGGKHPRGYWLCPNCEPVANSICTTLRRCACAPARSDECCCVGVPNRDVLHFTPDDSRALTCEECLSAIVFINVNTGRKLAA
jgi:hypothetical protein